MSGWRWAYLALLSLSLYVVFGGPLPNNDVSGDVGDTIRHFALW